MEVQIKFINNLYQNLKIFVHSGSIYNRKIQNWYFFWQTSMSNKFKMATIGHNTGYERIASPLEPNAPQYVNEAFNCQSTIVSVTTILSIKK